MNKEFIEWEKQIQRARDVLENPKSYELSHQGENGRKGLANFLAYAAVTESEGETAILDEYEKLFEETETKSRYRNIAERLVENEIDGRERLRKMISSAEMKKLSHLNNENSVKDYGLRNNTPVSKSSKKTSIPNGGETQMTDQEVRERLRDIRDKMEEEGYQKDELREMINTLEQEYERATDLADQAAGERDDYRQLVFDVADRVETYLEGDKEELSEMAEGIEETLNQYEVDFNLYVPDFSDVLESMDAILEERGYAERENEDVEE